MIAGLGAKESIALLAQQWHWPFIPCPLRLFANKEWALQEIEPVTQKNILLIHDLGLWQSDALMALGLLTHSLKQGGAKTITLVVPFLPYGRQNGGKKGHGFGILKSLLTALPVDRLATCTPHDPQAFRGEAPFSCDFFQEIPGCAIFAPHLMDQGIDLVVTPDRGGQQRAASMAKYLDCPVLGLSKTRLYQDPKGVSVTSDHPGCIAHKRCLIVDDMIDTGATLVKSIDYLVQHGAKSVTACATHGVFTDGCLEHLRAVGLNDLWISNTIPLDFNAVDCKAMDSSGSVVTGPEQVLTIHQVPWVQAFSPQPMTPKIHRIKSMTTGADNG